MSAGNATFHERNAVYTLAPQLLDDGSASTAWVPMSNSVRLAAVVQVGATDTTVDAKIEQATDSSGTSAKDVSGAAITQLSGTDDGSQAIIEFEAVKLDAANGFAYARLTVTAGDGTAGAYVSGTIIVPTRHAPVTQPDTVVESVVLAG